MSGKATESDILAWIEGELPESRAEAVEAAFKEDQSLRDWAASMRRDRVALQAWASAAVETAPRGMAESALERVEREALLGPSEAEILAAEPRPESPAVVFRIRKYATAAAVVLLVGVIGVTGIRLGQNPGFFGGTTAHDGLTDGRLAMNPEADPEQSLSEPHEDLLDAVNRASRRASKAEATQPQALAAIEAEQDEVAEEMAEMDVIASAGLADADDSSADAFMRDLNEGADPSRLNAPVIRPLSNDTAFATLIGQLIGEVAIAGGPATSISPERASQEDVRDRVVIRVVADDPDAVMSSMQQRTKSAESPVVGWHVVTGEPGDVSPVDGAVCTVSLPGEAAGFRWLVAALTESGASSVELTLRDGADPGPGGSGIADAAGALWWGEPIRVWAGWVRTPILISPSGSGSPADRPIE